MAQPDLDFFVRRALLVKAEVTEGTDSIPAGATNGIMLFEGSSGTEFDKVERNPDRAFFGGREFGISNERGFIEGDFELYSPSAPGNAGATGNAACEPLLLPSGMAITKNLGAKTSRYNPISSAIPTATAYWWQTDKHKQLVGCRNNLSSLSQKIGDRFKGRVRIQGTIDSITDTAIISPTLPSTVPVIATAENSTCNLTVNGGADILVWSKELTVDFANTLATKEYTSKRVNGITDRQPTFSLRIARTALADFDPWVIRRAGSVLTARFRTTNVLPTGLYQELGIRGQIEGINEIDIDGDYGWELTGPCIPSSAGGDELYILFGDSTP